MAGPNSVGSRLVLQAMRPDMAENHGDQGLEVRAQRALAWLFDDALPLWSTAGRNPRGGWFDRLDDEGRPVAGPMRMRVQARQVFVFAEAGRLGWTGPWREMVDHGLAFLTERATREDGVAAHSFAAEDGAVLEPGPELYDQSFTLLAYAAAFGATGDRRAKAAGIRLYDALQGQAHPEGGYREFDSPLLKSNPQMHMFEAALAWMDADDDPRWTALARSLATLCAHRLYDPASDALHEIFNDDWRRAPSPAGDVTEPGHHFEWAWLLAERELGSPVDLPGRLCARAERFGVDASRGVAVNAMDPWGTVLDGDARLWPQAERLKAALMMRAHDHNLWTVRACAAHDAMFAYIDAAPRGLWRDVILTDGAVRPESAPASSLYHITCAVSQLAQATGVVQARW